MALLLALIIIGIKLALIISKVLSQMLLDTYF